MIAWIAFTLTFLLLGLLVVGVAFRGGTGRRPAGRAGRGGRGGLSRGNRRATALGVGVVVLLLGIVVPVLILAGNSREEKGPGGVALNDADVDGRQVFARNCSTCHALKG